MHTSRRHLVLSGLAASLLATAPAVMAQDYPTKNITIVVPFSAGGGVDKRAAFDSNIPAIAEYKPLAKYQLENWFGLFAPSGTPDPILQKINAAVTQALKEPDLAKRLQDQGGEPAPMSVQQFRDFIQNESKQFQRIVETAQITAE